MQLEQFYISNYRSIDEQTISNISKLNVLIGKNNSGKSTILNSIEIFFTSLKPGEVAILDSPIRRDLDFYNRNADVPVEFRATLTLSLSERDELINEIANQVPEMKNATSSIPSSVSLNVTLRTLKHQKILSYISEISYAATDSPMKLKKNAILFSADDRAADEIYTALSNAKNLRDEAADVDTAISRIDRDTWEQAVRAKDRNPEYLQTYIGRMTYWSTGKKIEPTLTRVIRETSSYDDFIQSLRLISAERKQLAQDMEMTHVTSPLSTFTGTVTIVPEYVRSLIRRIGALKVHHLREHRRTIGPVDAERLLQMKVSRGGPENLRVIQGIVEGMLGVQVDAFATKAFNKEYWTSSRQSQPTAELDVDNFLVEANGTGIREALRMILDFEFERPDLFLIEEPEVHLHPALEVNMLRYLKSISYKSQIFITTHSTNFLDTSDIGNVYLVQKNEATKIRLLDVDDLVEEIPAELGIRLSSLFMFDRLVFVEGTTDEAIFREWASKIQGANLMTSNVGFIHLEGARNISHYAAEKIMSFLSKRQVKCWFLIDRDEKDDDDVKKLTSLLGKYTSIHVLSRREIENYLFCPHTLASHIQFRLSEISNGREVKSEEIQDKILEISDQLKLLAVHKKNY